VINTTKDTGDTMVGQRSGAMTSMEVVTGDIEFFTLYTTIDITNTDDFGDNSQKDFESVVQVIGMRAMPIVMNNPVELDGTGNNLLENYGAPSMTGAGWIFKFATERPGAHTVETLVNEFDNIVLNGGTVDTKNSKNMEFTKQDLL
jgi:hypothetical protein